jgi:hypothetical protein
MSFFSSFGTFGSMGSGGGGGDPFAALQDVTVDIDVLTSPVTFSSGTVVATAEGVNGSGNMATRTAGKGPTKTDDYFIFDNVDDELLSVSNFGATETQSFLIAGRLPSTLGSAVNIISFDNQTFRARIFVDTSGLIWQQNEASGSEEIIGTVTGGMNFCIAIVFDNGGSAHIYRAQDVNGSSLSPYADFDPRGNYTLATKMSLGYNNSQPLNTDNYRLHRFTHALTNWSASTLVPLFKKIDSDYSLGLI